MSTTALVVELVVVGVGTLSCLIAAIITFFGYDWVTLDDLGTPVGLLLVLATSYVLGIAVDRLMDVAVDGPSDAIRRSKFGDDRAAYYAAKNLVYTHEPFRLLAEYNRSRIRVVRGWAANCALAVPVLNGVIWAQLPTSLPRLRLAIVGSCVFVTLGWACSFAWLHMTRNSYERVKEQADFLRAREVQRP